MKIEYDCNKRIETLKQRGLDFEDALHVFNSKRSIDWEDTRKDYGEKRLITMGLLDGRHVIIVYTRRDRSLRIISMRKANEREIHWFEEQFEEG